MRLLQIVFGVVILAALAWTGWWFLLARGQEAALDAWFDDRARAGWQAEHNEIRLTGFPLELRREIDGIRLADPKTGWDTYWIGLNGDFLHRLREHAYIAPERPRLRFGVDDALAHSFLTILDRVRATTLDNPLLLAAGAMDILARLLKPSETETPETPASLADVRAFEDRIVAEAIRFIWNHSHRPMTVENRGAASSN